MQEKSVVETTNGKIQGRFVNGIHAFKGVPYGADTGGEGRFMPPRSPAPWSGVREAFSLGPQCPQPVGATYMSSEVVDFYRGAVEGQPYNFSEDCLVLNIWTPSLGDGSKRPVMVWLHGGGFEQGSGGAAWYDGGNLAGRGNVVVVSLNHRLNALGYLHLAAIGDDRYSESGNVGMLDIVEALRWVRDNIENFGGDRNNVTVFGSSGGGCKTSVLLAMPGAENLFHKAIVMSGVINRYQRVAGTSAERFEVVDRLIDVLGISRGGLHKLHSLPVASLYSAMSEVQKSMGDKFGMQAYGPVIDGRSLPVYPFGLQAPSISAHVPMLVGSTKDESRVLLGMDAFSIDEMELRTAIGNLLDVDEKRVRQLIDIYKTNAPLFNPSDILFAISTDHHFRMDAIRQSELKAIQAAAPVYMYQFAWESPACGGKFKSAHGAELPFVFANLDKAPGLGASADRQRGLVAAVSDAWIAFAHSGNPHHSNLPAWQPYSFENRNTMIFDDVCRSVDDPGAEIRMAMQAI